ncbi:MAG: hypothetical protein JNN21_06080 [Candidatus Accumulibacter sp.]|nr:hypothetical protein [Accumulibacter sp.]
MKFVVLSAALVWTAAAGVAQATSVQLFSALPDTQFALGTQADTGTGPLEVSFNAVGGEILQELAWWGYQLPDPTTGSIGTDQFEILLNGVPVGSQSIPLGTIHVRDAHVDLGDPAGGPATVDLLRYSLVFEPGQLALAGSNTLSVGNEDFSASWFWQGSENDPSQPAYVLTGERAQPVPEPMSLALVLAALAAAGGSTRIRGARSRRL